MISHCTFIRLCRTRDRLREVGDRKLTINEIAREAAVSPYHFIRLFSAVFGETPHQFRMGVRLEEAKRRLAVGEGSVTDVCAEVGFASLGSFSSLFSRRFGESPSAYRQRLFSVAETPGAMPNALVPWCTTLMVAAWEAESQFSRSTSASPVADCATSTRGACS